MGTFSFAHADPASIASITPAPTATAEATDTPAATATPTATPTTLPNTGVNPADPTLVASMVLIALALYKLSKTRANH